MDVGCRSRGIDLYFDIDGAAEGGGYERSSPETDGVVTHGNLLRNSPVDREYDR